MSLHEEDLEFLQTHTRFDENAIKEWHHSFQQDFPDGQLRPEDFIEMYNVFFPNGNAEDFFGHMFRVVDANENGLIDFREFLLAIDVTSAGTVEEKLNWAFKIYDINKNGVIDQVEMTKIVQAIYNLFDGSEINPSVSVQERVKSIFSQLDENRDDLITREEFVTGCLQDNDMIKWLAPNAIQ